MKTFLSAEIGINHNGDINICKSLIDMAAESGFNAVKFQKRDINIVYTQDYLSELRESPWGKTQRDQKAGLEFNYDQYLEIDNYCNSKNLKWYASCWDENSLIFMDKFNCEYQKVASAMITDLSFLENLAHRQKYTFISTGMCTLDMIDTAVNIFKKSNCPFELMHTVSTYPMEDEDDHFNIIVIDPPFFYISTQQLLEATNINTNHDYSTKIIIAYLVE